MKSGPEASLLAGGGVTQWVSAPERGFAPTAGLCAQRLAKVLHIHKAVLLLVKQKWKGDLHSGFAPGALQLPCATSITLHSDLFESVDLSLLFRGISNVWGWNVKQPPRRSD